MINTRCLRVCCDSYLIFTESEIKFDGAMADGAAKVAIETIQVDQLMKGGTRGVDS